MIRIRLVSVGWLAALLAFAGCNTGPQLAPVRGKVTFDGRPLAKGTIRFESAKHRPATGQIVNGEIVEVTTNKPGDGVPVGAQKVAIWANDEAASAVVANPGEGKGPGANYMGGKSLIPAEYNDPEMSGLAAEISAGENAVEFNLFSDPSKRK